MIYFIEYVNVRKFIFSRSLNKQDLYNEQEKVSPGQHVWCNVLTLCRFAATSGRNIKCFMRVVHWSEAKVLKYWRFWSTATAV